MNYQQDTKVVAFDGDAGGVASGFKEFGGAADVHDWRKEEKECEREGEG